MRIFALIGRSGSGKSHRAQDVARKYGIEYIIDDGLLIRGNNIIAGTSAKREKTSFAAVKRAIFLDDSHRFEVLKAIEDINPDSILILGTSDRMVDRIADSLKLPYVERRIYIEDIATQREIDMAIKTRKEQGKHVIPVPTFAVRKDFSGYFIDSIKNLTRRDKISQSDEIENTVVRPTYSYLGKYTISNSAVKSMAAFAGEEIEGVRKVLHVKINNTDAGLRLDMDVSVDMGYPVHKVGESIRKYVKEQIEYMTAFNVIEVNIFIKTIFVER